MLRFTIRLLSGEMKPVILSLDTILELFMKCLKILKCMLGVEVLVFLKAT